MFRLVLSIIWCVGKNVTDTMIDISKSFVCDWWWQILNYRFKIHGFSFSCITLIFFEIRYSFLGLEREIGDDSENWLTGSSKSISFWSSGESVDGSNVGCPGDLSLKKHPQKKLDQMKNQLIIVVTNAVFKMGVNIIFSVEDFWAIFTCLVYAVLVYFLVSCQPAFKFEYFSAIRTVELCFGK